MNPSLEYAVGMRRITPAPDMKVHLAGYFNMRWCSGVFTDLHVRVLLFRQHGTLAAILHYDLLGTSDELIEAVLPRIDPMGLNRQNTLFTATHTHTAPEIRAARPGFNPDYIDFAAQETARAVEEAIHAFQEGEIFYGNVFEHRFSFNRRFFMKDGGVLTNPGKCNPLIQAAEGTADYEIPLFAIRRDGQIRVILANIVNHSDTLGGTLASADWPGFCAEAIRTQIPTCDLVMPLTGCAGNINHFDVTDPEDQTRPGEAQRIGSGYAAAILATLPNLVHDPDPILDIRCGEIPLPPREVFPEELDEAEDILRRYADLEFTPESIQALTSEDLAKRNPVLLKFFAESVREASRNTRITTFHYAGISLGNTVFVPLPGEPFVEIGLDLKKNLFHDKNAFILELSNGASSGYIPNAWNFRRGGYETTVRSNPISIHSAQILQRHIARIHR